MRQQQQTASQGMGMQGAPQPSNAGAMPAGSIRDDIRALNSSILLITQKMKYLVRNEKILGRNLIVLNKKIKSLSDKIVENQMQGPQGAVSSAELAGIGEKVSALEMALEDFRSRVATKEEVKELKFVIDSINPLEFATLSQVRDLIDKRMEELKRKEQQSSSSDF
jgi:vacuolar-type H+-ATPase subunit I/STV1